MTTKMTNTTKGKPTMRRIINSITVKAGIAATLCISLVLYPALRTSAKATYAGSDLKNESQVRSEASRYDGAIRAIASVASMKLENPDELKKALAILDREGSNLKFNRSKLIVLGLGDSTFANSVKKASSNKAAAEGLITEISSDPKAVFKLSGAQGLVTRIRQSAQTDAATLRRVAERLKAIAAKLKQTSNERGIPENAGPRALKFTAVGYRKTGESNESSLSFTVPQDPASVLIALVLVAVVFYVVGHQVAQQDEIAECQEAAEASRSKCVTAARRQPFPLNLAAEALCDSEWLLESAKCLLIDCC
jgi:hypothetical protein